MNDQHDPEQLASYAVGLVDGDAARATEEHVAGCQRCRQELAELREVDGALRRVPSEWFLDGPPPGGELVLQRTLRQVRKENGARRRRRRGTLVAAAVVGLVGVGAAGVALGRNIAGPTITAGPEAGARVLTGLNPSTGARLTVTLTPEAGWVRVNATGQGLPVGERCMLLVVDRSGNPSVVGSWVVPAPGEQEEYGFVSGAAVALGDVAAVRMQNFAGRELVSAPA